MSIEDASKLLWQQGGIPKTGFSIFKRAVLEEPSANNGLVVGKTGKSGKSVKTDFIKALSDFVSQLVGLAEMKRCCKAGYKRAQIEIER